MKRNPPRSTSVSIDPEVWQTIPEVQVDSEQIRQRGRVLRRRRRATTAGASIAALALISAISWTALNGASPGPQAPATGTDAEQTASPTEGSGPTPSPSREPDEETESSDEPSPSDGEVQPPRLQEGDLELLAADVGLDIDRLTSEGNMLDAGLLHPSGAYISITITAATADEISAALEHATADRPYVGATIAGHDVSYREAPALGMPAHWLLVSADGTQMISVEATPPGTEADRHPLSDSVIAIVERDLIPVLAEA